jgi:hypothetical protein
MAHTPPSKDAQILAQKSPGRLHFVPLCLTSVDPQYGTGFVTLLESIILWWGGGVRAKIHSYLISASDEGEWSSSRSHCFISGKQSRQTSKRKQGGHWSRSARFRNRAKSLVTNEIRTPDRLARSVFAIPADKSSLLSTDIQCFDYHIPECKDVKGTFQLHDLNCRSHKIYRTWYKRKCQVRWAPSYFTQWHDGWPVCR